jgi:hypothetical protein
MPQQLNLFENTKNKSLKLIAECLECIDPDELSPKEALSLIYNLKKMSND